MSGLMEYVVKDDYFNSVKEEVTCTICLDIKLEPMMCSKCQNSYCANCIKKWENQSSLCPFKCQNPSYTSARIIKNLVSKLNFKCKNGCNEIIPFDRLKTHQEFECSKLDYKDKYEKLLVKYKQLELEKKHLEEIVNSGNNNNIINNNIINNNIINNNINNNMDSLILNNPDEISFVYRIISEHYAPGFKLNLIYRASRDGDTGPIFHQHCDNKQGGVLIVIQTDKNIKFGGFSDAAWTSYTNPMEKTSGKNVCGNINFLYQVNNRKKFALTNYTKILTGIFCRADVGPCFGELGEDIWIKGRNFLTYGGLVHKDKDNGRTCSYNTNDYELTNGERVFKIKELEAFWLNY